MLREAIANCRQAESELGLLARSLFKLSAVLAEIEDTVNDGHAIPESRRLLDEAVEEAGAALPDNSTERDYDELVNLIIGKAIYHQICARVVGCGSQLGHLAFCAMGFDAEGAISSWRKATSSAWG